MSQINIYEPRTLVAGLNQCRAPRKFLSETFFSVVKLFDTYNVDIDVKQGNQDIAVYVHPLEKGRLVENAGFLTRTVSPCYTKEIKVIRPNDTITRLFGEDYSAPLSANEREQRLLGEALLELDNRVHRLEEVMAAQALIHGKVHVKGKEKDYQLDLGYTIGRQKIYLSGDSCWDRKGDPMFDLDDWSKKISQRAGLAPNIIICGDKALQAIYNSETVKERLDLRNFHVGEINSAQEQTLSDQGVIYHGRLAPSNIPIYTYGEVYTNPLTGELEPLIPDDVVLVGCKSAGCQMLYGMIQNLHSLKARPRFPLSWIAEDGSARYIQLESAPLPNLYQVDAFIVGHVLSNY